MSNSPIGIFDSGVGGLTVARAVKDQLPRESILYIGDTARSPYGPKPIADVRRYSLAILDDLVRQGVKMLVIACNTASSAMLRDARERYSVPVVEVIKPAVRSAVRVTRNRRVGVIGTQGTINSRAYEDAFAAATDLSLYPQACPRFVEFVEAGVTTGNEVLALAREYLSPLREAGVDTVVLGCTHYPFLEGIISYVLGDAVTLVSSDIETAKDVYRTLVDEGIERRVDEPPSYRYEATGASAHDFIKLAERFIGPHIPEVNLIDADIVSPDGGPAGSAGQWKDAG